MTEYRYDLSLRIWHPSIAPEDITTALALTPDHAWKAGSPRVTPKGKPLTGTNERSYWTARLIDENSPSLSLPEAMHRCMSMLDSHKALLQRIRSGGGRCEFFVGWYFDGNSGDVFDQSILSRLTDLQIDLSFDVYPQKSP